MFSITNHSWVGSPRPDSTSVVGVLHVHGFTISFSEKANEKQLLYDTE